MTKAKSNSSGNMLAYGLGYDYAKGFEGINSYKTSLYLHLTQSDEYVALRNSKAGIVYI